MAGSQLEFLRAFAGCPGFNDFLGFVHQLDFRSAHSLAVYQIHLADFNFDIFRIFDGDGDISLSVIRISAAGHGITFHCSLFHEVCIGLALFIHFGQIGPGVGPGLSRPGLGVHSHIVAGQGETDRSSRFANPGFFRRHIDRLRRHFGINKRPGDVPFVIHGGAGLKRVIIQFLLFYRVIDRSAIRLGLV